MPRNNCVTMADWCLSDWHDFERAAAAVVLETMPGEYFASYRDGQRENPLTHSELKAAVSVTRTFQVTGMGETAK